jgi:hypothetical protein
MNSSLKALLSILLINTLLIATVSSKAAGLLDSGYTATYEVLHNEFYLGDAVRTLEKADDSWVYRSHTAPKGVASAFVSDVIDESSSIQRLDNTVRPNLYSYHQHSGKKETKFQLEFDWDVARLTNTYKKKTVVLKAGTHDLLSFTLQLMLDLQDGQQSVAYTIADKKRIDTYQLKLIEKEQIETSMKTFDAVKLVSNKIRNKMQFIIWCAPELDYLPVKVMKIEEDGDESVLLLKSAKPN